mgnify:CR=1 FL=1
MDFAREIETDGVKIHFDCLADGVVLDCRNEAVWLRTADCPTIIAHNSLTNEVVAAHAGRASLIDQKNLQNGRPNRWPESIVQAMYQRLIDPLRQSVWIEVYSCCGIGPKQFCHPIDHPQYGSFNEKMNRYIALNYGQDCFLDGKVANGALDLHRLIGNQFKLCGVPGDNIHRDSIDIAGENDYFFSRRGGDQTGHNTILVIRRA